ncbi:DUF2813 domain-containing protein [Niveibacterium sp. SC-1]|uniref:ATP-dependent nuclease n=1 Tax=Niveibacterium sp. SC-1 TaxID=3135646 RepID=UPI00311DF8B5
MRLAELEVRNFRGIAHAHLQFDGTVLLFGENDVGKTALFDALALVLTEWPEGQPPLQASDVRAAQTPQPIVIEVLCAEEEPGEWDRAACEPLRERALPPHAGLRALRLRMEAAPDSLQASWSVASTQGSFRPANAALLRSLRRQVPLVQIRSTRTLALGAPAREAAEDGQSPARMLVTYWQALQRGEVALPLGEGAELAQRYLGEGFPSLRIAGPGEPEQHLLAHEPAPQAPVRAGAAARKMALLMLASALVEDGFKALAPGARPLVIVEDPEAHLHPMTLAALWDMLAGIRAQKLVSSQSGHLLAAAPLGTLCRLTQHEGVVSAHRVREQRFSAEDLRKFSYHLRIRNGVAMFARCWLLVEGETEYWALSELARLRGFDFAQEGVACVEFAQCGVQVLVRMARELGIEWHVLADGDDAGQAYANTVRHELQDEDARLRLTVLAERDIENCFWHYGFEAVFREAAGIPATAPVSAARVIAKAIQRRSKPYLAFAVARAAAERGPASVPPPIAALLETCVNLARRSHRRARHEARIPEG